MNRITTQQAGTFFEIILSFTLTHNNRTQAQVSTATRFFDQDASQQATNPSKTEKNDVFGLAAPTGGFILVILTNDIRELTSQKRIKRLAAAFAFEFDGQLAQINVRDRDYIRPAASESGRCREQTAPAAQPDAQSGAP